MGSQAIGSSIYQYRLILHEEDKMLSCASDMDFNSDVELKFSPMKQVGFKTALTVSALYSNNFHFVKFKNFLHFAVERTAK